MAMAMAAVVRCRWLLAHSQAQQWLAPWSASVAHLTTAAGGSDWSDFNAVAKALREIAKQQQESGQLAEGERRLPSTKMLKELGQLELVRAIRKNHGGFVKVAERLGAETSPEAFEIHKQKTSRENRRRKRLQRIAKHDFF
ncbi:hypothetical protein PybrP1_012553 [[Pythium] brassicae (nom. inval.)]|nr:hypothetical protein PybrP1_012553 [[Pythium] brassicae (nom. inval.)]